MSAHESNKILRENHSKSISQLESLNPQLKSKLILNHYNLPVARKASLNNSRTLLPYSTNPEIKRVGLRPVYRSSSYNKVRSVLPTIDEGSIIERNYIALKK